ncbi:MAG: hypothetical protein ACHQUC_09670 [Chlamydiales bacterium]
MIRVLITHAKQTFEPQTTSLSEGPIKTIPTEILQSILFLTNHSESTRLVSRNWNVLTFTPAKNSNIHELNQTISLITEKLNPDTHAECIAALAAVQDAHESCYVNTFAEVRRLFLINKGLVIGILRKLPEEERDQLQIAIGEELPDSMKDLFEISKLDLTDDLAAVENLDLDTFFTLLQSCQPLSMDDREKAFFLAVYLDDIEFVKLVLADGPISEYHRALAVCEATENNNPDLVRLLLSKSCQPLSIDDREKAFFLAVHLDDIEFVKLVLADGPISEDHRGFAVYEATENNNPDLVRLLLSNGPISEDHRELAISTAIENNHQELLSLFA